MPLRPEIWIAQRLYFAQQNAAGGESTQSHTSRPAVRVALAGIIIGVLVMIVTLGVVVGFKQTITDKVAGFGAHIQVVNFDNNNTYEMQPITVSDSLLGVLRSFEHVQSVQPFATKPGIVKTADAFQGMVLKGTDYWDYFAANLSEGALPQKPQEVLISQMQSQQLGLHTGEAMYCYFVDESVRVRKFTISGIYETGFGDFDKLFVLGNIGVIQRLNDWDSTEVSGVEVLLDNVRHLDKVADEVYFATVNHFDEDGYNVYYVQTLQQLNPQVFAWLDLLDMNVAVIIILMLCVSGFCIISGLIILILDSIQLIGVLKALGATNRFVRRIFISEAAMLIGKGMLWGNVLGLGLCAVQYWTHLLPLEAATYYVNYVPIAFPWGWWLLLNIGTLLVSLLIMLAPSAIVTKISPAKVMHFE